MYPDCSDLPEDLVDGVEDEQDTTDVSIVL